MSKKAIIAFNRKCLSFRLEQVLQWHRRNKLPEYSQNFARLAVLIQQNDIPLPLLRTALDKIDGMPHID